MSEPLRAHVKRRLGFALASAAEQVLQVDVRLTDVNGPRGGVDKRCRISVELPSLPTLMIEDIDAAMYAAINRSVAWTGRVVTRKLKRRQTITPFRRADSRRLLSAAQVETLI